MNSRLNKIFIINFIIICIIINLLLLYNLNRRNDEINYLGNSIELLQNTKELNILLKSNCLLQHIDEGKAVNNVDLLNINGTKTCFKDVVSNSPKLVLYFSEKGCVTCIDNTIKLIKNYASKISKSNLIVIASFENVREFKLFTYEIEYDTFLLRGQNLGLDIENFQIPFIFYVDNNMFVRNLFIPSKEIHEISINYLDIMVDRFFK
jgi:hypothetical protein